MYYIPWSYTCAVPDKACRAPGGQVCSTRPSAGHSALLRPDECMPPGARFKRTKISLGFFLEKWLETPFWFSYIWQLSSQFSLCRESQPKLRQFFKQKLRQELFQLNFLPASCPASGSSRCSTAGFVWSCWSQSLRGSWSDACWAGQGTSPTPAAGCASGRDCLK